MNHKTKLTLNIDKLFSCDFEYIWNIEKLHVKYNFLFIGKEGFLDFKKNLKERSKLLHEKEKFFSYHDKGICLYSGKEIPAFSVCYLI